MMTGLVERVLITLPHAQRISASTYFGCISAFIKGPIPYHSWAEWQAEKSCRSRRGEKRNFLAFDSDGEALVASGRARKAGISNSKENGLHEPMFLQRPAKTTP